MGGAPSGRDAHTVAEVVAGYIADGARRLSPGSIDFYRKGEAAMPAGFAARHITSVTPLVLDNAYGEMRAAEASEHKVQKVHRFLSAAFNRAVRYGWIAANPCVQATKPKTASPEIEPPTPEQVRAIIAEAEDVNDDLAVCIRLAAVTGARRGEPVALQWSDFKGERMTIRRSLVASDDKLIERPTKTGTKGHRTIAVDAATLAAVEALRVRQAGAADEHGLPAPEYVFTPARP